MKSKVKKEKNGKIKCKKEKMEKVNFKWAR